MRTINCLLRDRRGATSIEYAIITGFVAVALIVSLGVVGQNLSNVFTSLATGFGGGGTVTPPASAPNATRGV